VHGLSHAYRHFETGFVPAFENDMAYNADLRFCSTVGDLYQLWTAIADKKLLEPKTFAMMTTAEGAAQHMSARRSQRRRTGFAMILNSEEDHRRIGQHGSLFGLQRQPLRLPSPRTSLTIIVLTNTEGQNAYAITRALARARAGPAAAAAAERAARRARAGPILRSPPPSCASSPERSCSGSSA